MTTQEYISYKTTD